MSCYKVLAREYPIISEWQWQW